MGDYTNVADAFGDTYGPFGQRSLHAICRTTTASLSRHRGDSSLPQRANDPFVHAIVSRIRSVITRQNGHALDALATTLRVDPNAFRAVLDQREVGIDIPLLVDVVSALVWELAIDPTWLLSGQYDARTHRQTLLLGEDRSAAGVNALRSIVWQKFNHLRNPE